jgi:hypothetical protein
MQNLPGYNNGLVYEGKKLPSWWDFGVDMDEAIGYYKDQHEYFMNRDFLDLNPVLPPTVPPPPNPVPEILDTVSGTSSNSNQVSTGSIAGQGEQTWVAIVSSKPNASVTSVTGLNLNWQKVAGQCAGRNQTGVEMWRAYGPASEGVVTATLAKSVSNAVITVTRFAGEVTTTAQTSGNTNGISGACSSGVDNTSYSLSATSAANSLTFAGVALRGVAHNPGTGETEVMETHTGSGGNIAGLALVSTSSNTIAGTFSSNVDWAVVGVNLVVTKL